jgi:hypothetical protein
MRCVVPRNILELTLEVIFDVILEVVLEHVLRTKTMTSLILDHVARDYLYLGINTGEKDMFLELSRDNIMIVLELS